MKMHFYIDSNDEAERCRKSFQAHAPTVVTGLDTMTGRIKPYSGVVLAVDPIESHGVHWRITMDVPERSQPAQRAA
jgi:hypothetical protein